MSTFKNTTIRIKVTKLDHTRISTMGIHPIQPIVNVIHSTKRQLVKMVSKVPAEGRGEKSDMTCPSDVYDRLCRCPADVPVFNFAKQSFWVRLFEIHDADSPKVIMEINGKLFKSMTRLIGIDTPEIRSKNADEKKLAVRARNRVAQWALPNYFTIDGEYSEKQIKEILWKYPVVMLMFCEEQDKFGRVLARLYRTNDGAIDDMAINDVLVSEGYADRYDGGTKLRSWSGEIVDNEA